MAKKKELPLPLEFTIPAKWTLMKKNTMPGFHTDSATIHIPGTKRTWEVKLDLLGRAMFLFTDLARDDDGLGKAIYELPLLRDNVNALATALLALKRKPRK